MISNMDSCLGRGLLGCDAV